MYAVRSSLKAKLNTLKTGGDAPISGLGNVADYGCTDSCLESVEHVVFPIAAILMGDSREDVERYTPALEKHYIEIDLLLFVRGKGNVASTDTIAIALRRALWEQNLGLSTVITARVEEQEPLQQIHDELWYSRIVWRCIMFETTTG